MLDPAGRVATHRRPDPGRPPRGVQGRRTHAHARAHRRGRPADRRIRPDARCRLAVPALLAPAARPSCRRRATKTPEPSHRRPRPDHRRARHRGRPLDRGRHGRHRRHRPALDGGVGRGPRRSARVPRARAARPVPAGRARRRGGVHRRIGVRPRRGRRRHAGARSAGPRLPVGRRSGADRPDRGGLRPRRVGRRAPGAGGGRGRAAPRPESANRSRPAASVPAPAPTVGKWKGARPPCAGWARYRRRRGSATSPSECSRS